MPSCYYYDEQSNRCNCYINENLDELLAENAKLREQSERLFDKTLELATENSKLRELVRAAWGCVHSGVDCYECRVVAGGCTLQSAMRKLGIDVARERDELRELLTDAEKLADYATRYGREMLHGDD